MVRLYYEKSFNSKKDMITWLNEEDGSIDIISVNCDANKWCVLFKK